MIDGKWTVGSNVPWDNMEFLLLLMETKVPVIIPTQGRGVLVGRVVYVCDTHMCITSIEGDVKDPVDVYLNEISESIYVADKLTRYEKHKGDDDNG